MRCGAVIPTPDKLKPTDVNITKCAACLKAGGLVAFPTETVYALGADATNEAAVKKVFEVKGRPLDKPLIVAVSNKSAIDTVAKNIPAAARLLINKFMPGALTLLLDRADCIPDAVTAGTDTVAVRIPDNEVALKLIELAGRPIVVPSANTSDKPSPTLASHVTDDLDGKIDFVLDGGASEIGIESTIVDTRTNPPSILRGGGVSVDEIEKVIGKVEFKREPTYSTTGYVPRAEVLFSAMYEGMHDNINARYDKLAAEGRTIVILCLDDNAARYESRNVYTVGKTYADYAHNIFALLRRADADGYDTVIAEGVESKGIGSSLINRLIKVSGGQII